MGVVFAAYDRKLGKRVAAKMLREVDPAALLRFKKEFRALAGVAHPNLLGLHELVADGGRLLLTMELVEGTTFLAYVRGASPDTHAAESATAPGEPTLRDPSTATLVERAPRGTKPLDPRPDTRGMAARRALGPLDETRLRSALPQVVRGVSALHAAGMLHRDLKPSNVLVTNEGQVKILDFGLVRELDESTFDHDVAGTASYMSPEQARGRPLTAASDLYAIGVMLFEALTGRLPFEGGPDTVLMRKCREDAPRASALAEEAPADLVDLAARLLARRPAERPSAAEVLAVLGAEPGSALEPLPLRSGALVGRESEMATLLDALAESRRDKTVLVLVRGESGMGKSALLRAFSELATEQGAVVLEGRCYERESVPYKALDGVVDSLARHLARLPRVESEGLMPRDVSWLARLFPVLEGSESVVAAPRKGAERGEPGEGRYRAFLALREVLARMADRRALVVAMDDVQWGDLDSAAALAAVLRPPDAPSMLLVASFRTEDEGTSEFVVQLRAEAVRLVRDVRLVELGRLSREDSERLARERLGVEDEASRDEARRIAVESEGNPYFVESLVQTAREKRQGDLDSDTSLDSALRRRIERLPEGARRFLEAAALAGKPVEDDVLAEVSGVDAEDCVRRLSAERLLRTRSRDGRREVECLHERVREAVLGVLTPGCESRLHLALAEALEQRPHVDPEDVGRNLAAAGHPERAAKYAERAADAAYHALAFDRAAVLYRVAVDLAAEGSPERRSLSLSLAHALAQAGRGREAADLYLALREGAKGEERVELSRWAGEALLRSGYVEDGVRVFEEVLAEVGMRLAPTPGRAMLSFLYGRARLALRGLDFVERDASEVPAARLRRIDVGYAATTGLAAVDSIRAADFQTHLVRLALDAGEPRRVLDALGTEATFRSLEGIGAEPRAMDALHRLEKVAARLGTGEAEALVATVRGIVQHQLGRFALSFEELRKAVELLETHAPARGWELATVQLFELYSALLLGRVAYLRAKLPELQIAASTRGDLYFGCNLDTCVGYWSGLGDDDAARARAELEEALARWTVREAAHVQHFNAMLSATMIDLYEGDAASALARMERGLPIFEKAHLLRVETLRIGAWSSLGRAAVALGRTEPSALRVAARCASRLEREKAAYGRALGALVRAGIAGARRDEDAAHAALERAETDLHGAELRLFALPARWLRGELLGGSTGRSLVREVEATLRAEGLANPRRIVAMLLPGF